MRDTSVDYERHGRGYARRRRADPRIGAMIEAALGDARTVVNVGAGAGSYEPRDRYVLAVEPSATMRAQRPRELAPAVVGRAEALPLDDGAVDAAMAVLTVHHWSDPADGLRELRRVARGPVAVLTFDVEVLARMWLVADYLPEVAVDDRERFPPPAEIAGILGGARIETVPIPADCTDGFFEAYFARPEAYLDPDVRAGQSAWPRLPRGVAERALAALEQDLRSGAWDARHGHLRSCSSYDGGLRLVVAEPLGGPPAPPSNGEELPLVDVHDVTVAAAVDDVWAALLRVVDAGTRGRGAVAGARLLGCADTEHGGPRPLARGSTVPGFRVSSIAAPVALELTGRHRFSRYRLAFAVEPLTPKTSRLLAETRAEFPGVAGPAYRAAVIGTRLHVVAVRRILGAVARRASRGHP